MKKKNNSVLSYEAPHADITTVITGHIIMTSQDVNTSTSGFTTGGTFTDSDWD